MQFPLRLRLRPSRLLAAALVALHGAALGALWPLTFPLWLRLAFGAALVASLIRGLWHGVMLRSRNAVVELDGSDDGRLVLTQRDGVCVEADVLAASAVLAWAVLLRVHVTGERRARSVVVFPDSLDGEGFRRLRIWLRWKRPVSAA